MNTDIFVLTGFLGSGKTTLLSRMLQHLKRQGKCPAVIMNELGDVNLDGLLIEHDVPMSEMLSGCICCTIRGDLGLELSNLVEREHPDVILIESTGAANPMEIIDAVTDSSLLVKTRLQAVITVVDASFFYGQAQKAAGKTWRLLREQVRGATHVVVNKLDLVAGASEDKPEARAVNDSVGAVVEAVRAVNGHASLELVERCEVDVAGLFGGVEGVALVAEHAVHHHGHEHDHGYDNEHGCGSDCGHKHHAHEHEEHHHSHSHLLVYTQHLTEGIDSAQFTKAMRSLPESVYRAKGVVTFADTGQRVMFQYAYRELECTPIVPQRELQDVVVFIGEHLPEEQLARVFG